MAGFDFYVQKKEDLINAVEEFGFVPLFKNSIPGFSVEEHASPAVWYNAVDDNWPVWEWKGPVIRETGCAYGKFFEHKAVFVSRKWFPDFANFRRDGYDFDARFDDGLASYREKDLFDLLDKHAPVLSRTLKEEGDYRKGGKKGFDTVMNHLQAMCYAVISDFVYLKSKSGKTYGWGVAEYSTPEKLMGRAFTDEVYRKTPEESCALVLEQLMKLVPEASENAVRKLLGAAKKNS